MFRQTLVIGRSFQKNVRLFRTNNVLLKTKEEAVEGNKPTVCPAPSKRIEQPITEDSVGSKSRAVTNFEKWLLVTFNKYPSAEEVPQKVPSVILAKVYGQARIRLANLMMILTLMGCLWAVVTGKDDAKAGKTVYRDNVEWHKRINKEHEEAEMAKKSK